MPARCRAGNVIPRDRNSTWLQEYPSLDLEHLRPSAQSLARLPGEERVQRIRADRWIGYPRAVQALERLDSLFQWPAKQRMPNLLLIGPTNNGKSMIVEKFYRQHEPCRGVDAEQVPVLAVQMPSEPSVPRFYAALLAAVGAPLRPRQRVGELEHLALSFCFAASGCGCWSSTNCTTCWPAATPADARS